MINVYVQRTKELMADLRKAGGEVQEEARKVLDEMSARIADDARSRVPVDTGALRSSIKKSVSRKKLEAAVWAGGKAGGTDTYYAVFVEFGTKNVPAQPFIFPAGRAHEQETEERLTAVMYEALRRGVEG